MLQVTGVGEKKYEKYGERFLALLAALEKGNENRRKEKKMMTAEEVRKRIEELSEPSYQQFSARLIPNVKAERIRGVRLPHLRKLAKEIVKGDWRAYLEEKSEVEKTFEETMLRGLVIGYAKMEWKELA